MWRQAWRQAPSISTSGSKWQAPSWKKIRSWLQALRKAAEEPGITSETANLRAILEVENPGNNTIKAALDVLRLNVSLKPARESCGKVLRYNLARLLEETGGRKEAATLYQEIFEHDRLFLDVRERLGTLTPAVIALSECQKNLRILTLAINRWQARVGALPGVLDDLVPESLSRIPTCPVSHRLYAYSREAAAFSLFCPGHHHEDCGLRKNEPSFHSSTGDERLTRKEE